MELIPGLPEEIGLECLTRLHHTTHQVATQTCHEWQKLLKSPAFHQYRKQRGYTHIVACLVQSIPAKTPGDETQKPANSPTNGITVFDSVSQTWERLSQVPKYPNGLPLFCQVVSSDRKLVVMGGWDPVSYNPVRDVFIYDFAMQLWRRGKDMPSKRSFFAMGAIDSHVYIAGGHDESKNALKSAWVYDLRQDTWCELSQMNRERDECEGVVVGREFWVVSGYGTNNQGVFGSSAESYCVRTGTWNQVDSVWKAGECPRLSVIGSKNGKFVSFFELNSEVPGGVCGVEFGGQILVTGSAQGGVQNGVFLMEFNEGKKIKIQKVNVPDEFCAFIQSGCCVDI